MEGFENYKFDKEKFNAVEFYREAVVRDSQKLAEYTVQRGVKSTIELFADLMRNENPLNFEEISFKYTYKDGFSFGMKAPYVYGALEKTLAFSAKALNEGKVEGRYNILAINQALNIFRDEIDVILDDSDALEKIYDTFPEEKKSFTEEIAEPVATPEKPDYTTDDVQLYYEDEMDGGEDVTVEEFDFFAAEREKFERADKIRLEKIAEEEAEKNAEILRAEALEREKAEAEERERLAREEAEREKELEIKRKIREMEREKELEEEKRRQEEAERISRLEEERKAREEEKRREREEKARAEREAEEKRIEEEKKRFEEEAKKEEFETLPLMEEKSFDDEKRTEFDEEDAVEQAKKEALLKEYSALAKKFYSKGALSRFFGFSDKNKLKALEDSAKKLGVSDEEMFVAESCIDESEQKEFLAVLKDVCEVVNIYRTLQMSYLKDVIVTPLGEMKSETERLRVAREIAKREFIKSTTPKEIYMFVQNFTKVKGVYGVSEEYMSKQSGDLFEKLSKNYVKILADLGFSPSDVAKAKTWGKVEFVKRVNDAKQRTEQPQNALSYVLERDSLIIKTTIGFDDEGNLKIIPTKR